MSYIIFPTGFIVTISFCPPPHIMLSTINDLHYLPMSQIIMMNSNIILPPIIFPLGFIFEFIFPHGFIFPHSFNDYIYSCPISF